MPYNYLLDSKIRKVMDQFKLQNSIIIFDEAHNVESVCEEGVSFELSIKDFENCENEEKILQNKLNESPDESKISFGDIEDVMASIKALKKNFLDWKKEIEITKPGQSE